MKYYFAPMEGITNYVYRNSHNAIYKGIDQYYMPFIAPHHHHHLKTRETSDINPANNQNIDVVPQILSKNAEDVIYTLRQLMELGYGEVNLNLGCPSPTVTKKNKGSAMLDDLDNLDGYLDTIFKASPGLKISLKTRIGYQDTSKLDALISLYNKYPIDKLIVHPRTGIQMYKGSVDLAAFDAFYKDIKAPLVYNGDIKTIADIKAIEQKYPKLEGIMLGRGLIARPYLIDEYTTGQKENLERFERFIESLEDGLRETLKYDKDVLFKLKELWAHMYIMFDHSKKPLKHLRKAQNLEDYHKALDEMLECGINNSEEIQEFLRFMYNIS